MLRRIYEQVYDASDAKVYRYFDHREFFKYLLYEFDTLELKVSLKELIT